MIGEGIYLLKMYSGNEVKDWRDLVPLLALVDNTITQNCSWDCIRRNFLNEHDIWLDIEDGKFVCRDALDTDCLNTPEDEILRLKRIGYWCLEYSQYELTHSAEETLEMIKRKL